MTAALVAVSARAAIEHHSKSFALASRLLDPVTRTRTAVVYAYCRRTDDAVDEAPRDGVIGELDRDLDDVYANRARDPLLRGFAEVVHERAIPRSYPGELVRGMAMDAGGARYATLHDLHVYCYRVAGVVGLMMCHVFGVRDDAALVPAARLGVAMQLTNICRDVAEDWKRGRLYLPDDVLAPHGARGLAGDLGRPLPHTAVPPLACAVRDLLALADAHYRAADRGIAALPWRAALAVRAARLVYAAIGDRIAASGFDVTAPRAVVPHRAKLALVARAATLTLATLRPFSRRVHAPTRSLEVTDVPLA